jgi:BirA family biotin operon repressor/biotin-[acetyl-CoA-carboxylase] ligase
VPEWTPPKPLPDDFAAAFDRVRPRFGALASRVLFFSTTGSTNDVASSLAASGPNEGTVVIADTQTAGRGRRGRTWFSPPGAGLYVSIVLDPSRAKVNPERATSLLTLAAGVALAEAVQRATGLAPEIKWPNDLLIGRRKLAGILAEGGSSGGAASPTVLGYGINVAPAAYPRDLEDRATSLESELGRAVDRAALCAETIASIAGRYGDLLAGRFDAILDAWRALAPGSRGSRVSWMAMAGSSPRSGTTAGIDGTGALLVQTGDRIERLIAGEVNWI